MIRPLLTEIALFLTPFAVYAVFLWATRAAVLDPKSWSRPRLAWLTIAALVLLLGSFFVLAQFDHAPPGSTYVPAHVENGKLIPGEAK
jgi:heme/copper-type cytochrome/quinol oxidase subunit 3